jgi:hypothetical protein
MKITSADILNLDLFAFFKKLNMNKLSSPATLQKPIACVRKT